MFNKSKFAVLALLICFSVELLSRGPQISLETPLMEQTVVVLGFVIPYPGVVEIELYDSSGSMIWYNRYTDWCSHSDKGEHTIKIKRSALKPDETYSYRLYYKGSWAGKTFTN